MRRIKPILRTFRHQLRNFGSIPISRNWLLRRALYLLRRANCLISCKGFRIDSTVPVSTTLTTIRAADSWAKITDVWNLGAQSATIVEDAAIVAFIPPGRRQRLAVNGRLRLQAKTVSGSTSLRIITARRCACGDSESPYDVVIPTSGGDLI